jgi:hypothetical protein
MHEEAHDEARHGVEAEGHQNSTDATTDHHAGTMPAQG